MLTITLPYPNRNLSPNARVHWAVKAKYARMAREAGFIETLQAISQAPMYQHTNWGDEIPVTLEFHPPDNRRRDRDNAFSSMKAALDGIAKALDVNDSLFAPTLKWKQPYKNGKVVIQIGA